MEYRKLGRTGLDVSIVGLGTEYLVKEPRETVISVVHEALDRGVNYIDLLFPYAEYRDNFAAALEGRRDEILLVGHIGATEKDGQYAKTRSVKKSERFFHDLLIRLGTDYVDVAMLHNFNTMNDYEKAIKPNGQADLARQLQEEGKARHIGISVHRVDVATRAIEDGVADVLMFPVNAANHALPGRTELLSLCAARGIGVVAMKPYAGGNLLEAGRTVRVSKYQTGGEAYRHKMARDITPVQCLSYVLAQVGVSMALPGVKNVEELRAALHTLQASEAERDFSTLVTGFERYVEGECVYCNHCLPCPVHLDVGQVSRLVDRATFRPDGMAVLQAAYEALEVRASECTACGACVERCPFGVDVIAGMERAVELFE
jgi:hypothetical protein